jgi:hypothetical protein
LRKAQRVLELDGTRRVTGTYHIIFSVGFVLKNLGFKIIKFRGGRIATVL